MNFALPLTPERERTGVVWTTASPVHPSAREFPYNLVSYFPNPAKSRGIRCASGSGAFVMKGACKSSFLLSTFDLPNLAKADVHKASPLPFFLKVNDNRIHSQPPVRVLDKPNMEKSVSEVCNKELPVAEIEKAREIHQRLIVRMMTSPGDSSGAMFRIEAAFGLSYHCQKNLRYQNRASAEFVARLNAVWLSVLEASVTRDIAELLQHKKAEEAA